MKTVFAVLVFAVSVSSFAAGPVAAEKTAKRKIASVEATVAATCHMIAKAQLGEFKHSCQQGKQAFATYGKEVFFCCEDTTNY